MNDYNIDGIHFLMKYAKHFNKKESDIEDIDITECGVCKGFSIVNENNQEVRYFWHDDSMTVLEECDGDIKEASYIN